jgi:hypothetical protein
MNRKRKLWTYERAVRELTREQEAARQYWAGKWTEEERQECEQAFQDLMFSLRMVYLTREDEHRLVR